MSKILTIKKYPEKIQKAIFKEWEAYNLTQTGWWGDPSRPKAHNYIQVLLSVEPERLFKWPATSSLVTNADPVWFWKEILIKKNYNLMVPFYFPCDQEFETVTIDNETYNV